MHSYHLIIVVTASFAPSRVAYATCVEKKALCSLPTCHMVRSNAAVDDAPPLHLSVGSPCIQHALLVIVLHPTQPIEGALAIRKGKLHSRPMCRNSSQSDCILSCIVGEQAIGANKAER